MCQSLTPLYIAPCITPPASAIIDTRRKATSSRKCNSTGTGPRRNRFRDRQKLEILQLRAEAEVLAKRASEMRNKQREHNNDNALRMINTNKGTTKLARHYQGPHDSLLVDAWKDLAKRHRMLRKYSENENKNLRDVYRTQLETIEMLKKLLQNQEKMKVPVLPYSAYNSN
ncbi:hypothetical protein PHMEG_00030247 [Phytophthora megakarya]|uniref:Uncharacterized protein n=1 Tax=Phytophthora megakarya TaxID=4795 RepID=A0A225V0P1_9STRA|nr:hypothetical protein PHMEG_00030247 [Phytophthora megakarya]